MMIANLSTSNDPAGIRSCVNKLSVISYPSVNAHNSDRTMPYPTNAYYQPTLGEERRLPRLPPYCQSESRIFFANSGSGVHVENLGKLHSCTVAS